MSLACAECNAVLFDAAPEPNEDDSDEMPMLDVEIDPPCWLCGQ